MMDESQLYNRMQNAEASNNTLRQEMERMKGRWRDFKDNFGIRERSDGALEIDYDAFVDRLGLENWVELRQIGDTRYGMKGVPGEKPRVRVYPGGHHDHADKQVS